MAIMVADMKSIFKCVWYDDGDRALFLFLWWRDAPLEGKGKKTQNDPWYFPIPRQPKVQSIPTNKETKTTKEKINKKSGYRQC